MRANRGICQRIALFIMQVFLLSGCTLLLYNRGRSLNEKVYTVPPSKAVDLETGKAITVWMKTGASLHGVYHGLQIESRASYAERFESWLNAREAPHGLPVSEDTLSLSLRSGDSVTGLFHGFDRDVLYIGTRNGEEAIAMQGIDTITTHRGTLCDLEKIRELNEREELPVRTVIVLSSRMGLELIDPTEISHMRIDGKDYAKIGLIIGIPIDIALILWIIDFTSH